MRYPIAIEPGDETHAFGVIVPDLPGCFAAGDTLPEALRDAEDAIYLWLEAMLDHNDNFVLPRPASLSALASDPQYQHCLFAGIDIDLTKLDEQAENIELSLPAGALRRLDEAALKAGQSRAQYLTELILTAA